ncbi:hypothetical protein K431DRAFT_136150 [Polychaeton citri CBS 116435]|uniref:F-box domain-containing protein n=1 Tax=Polychaeton citri CBS 116435 TaxID=1314669 RepID=A0A9P4UMH7_9PEZI|nr:hypothetical protein K431DRAFT_136150 [Polychaeton citri CBS 116435]
MAATFSSLATELVSLVLEHLADDRGSLFSAALVCRRWRELAIDVLWRYPPLHALASLPPARQQHHANKIRSLYFLYREELVIRKQLAQVNFPGLTVLHVNDYDTRRHFDLDTYIQPSLKVFEISGLWGHLDDGTLDLLETRCPRLQDLRYNYVMPSRFFRLLERCNRLTGLGVRSGYHTDEDLTIYTALAARNGLLHLRDSGKVKLDMISVPLAQVPQPFRALKSFGASIEFGAAVLLLRYLNALEDLSLTLQGEDEECDFRQLISAILNRAIMTKLSIHFVSDMRISKDDLMLFEGFVSLTYLSVQSGGPFDLVQPVLTTEECTEVFSNLPKLDYLSITPDAGLHTSHLATIGQQCRLIRWLRYSTAFELEAMYDCLITTLDDEILFPELVSIELHGHEVPRDYGVSRYRYRQSLRKDGVVDRIADGLMRHAPKLEGLDIQDQGVVADCVRDVWGEKSGHERIISPY